MWFSCEWNGGNVPIPQSRRAGTVSGSGPARD